MRAFFALLRKYSFFLLFLVFETISLIFIFNYNRYHSSVIINYTNDFTSSMVKTSNIISDYFTLKQQNQELAKENAFLHNNMISSFNITDTIFYFEDTVFRYTEAHVIDNSVKLFKNYIILSKGKKHGLKNDMGVISPEGIAGILIGVSENYSIVMSLLHNNCQISALIKKNDQIANVSWNGENPDFGVLTDIPTHLEIRKGDTVVSSGFSSIFPKGLMLGIVEEYYNDPNNNLNSAKLRFSVDFDQLKNVYVIENLAKDELKQLRQNVVYE